MQFAICDSRFKIQDSRFKIQDSRFKIQDSRFKIQDSFKLVLFALFLLSNSLFGAFNRDICTGAQKRRCCDLKDKDPKDAINGYYNCNCDCKIIDPGFGCDGIQCINNNDGSCPTGCKKNECGKCVFMYCPKGYTFHRPNDELMKFKDKTIIDKGLITNSKYDGFWCCKEEIIHTDIINGEETCIIYDDCIAVIGKPPVSSCTFNCKHGHFVDNPSLNIAASCIICSKGSYCKDSAIKECPAGTYQNEEGKDSCKSCPDDAYQDKEGQTSCKQCPNNGDSNIRGSTKNTNKTSINDCFINTHILFNDNIGSGYYGKCYYK